MFQGTCSCKKHMRKIFIIQKGFQYRIKRGDPAAHGDDADGMGEKSVQPFIDLFAGGIRRRQGNDFYGNIFFRSPVKDPGNIFHGASAVALLDMFLEGKLDTEYLIKTVRDQILDPVGYDYDRIGFVVHDPKQEMAQQNHSMQM